MDDSDWANLKNKKILIIYTEMEDWSEEDKLESLEYVEMMVSELTALGFEDVVSKKIVDPIDDNFKDYDPKETVIFNWTESWGDNNYDYWTIPEHLEKLGFVYTGSGPACLKETIDKVATKKKMLANGISTPKTKIYEANEPNGWNTFPAIVKPAREHCSTGITRASVVDNKKQLHARIKYILKRYGPYGVIVEDFIDGDEYNVAVWGNEEPEVLPIGMIDYTRFGDYHDRILSFDAKWKEWEKTPEICPAPIDVTLKEKIEKLALATYKLLGIRDYARIDIRVKNGVPYVLDVNSNPDITDGWGLTKSTAKAGYSYGETVAKVLSMAAMRMIPSPSVLDTVATSSNANGLENDNISLDEQTCLASGRLAWGILPINRDAVVVGRKRRF